MLGISSIPQQPKICRVYTLSLILFREPGFSASFSPGELNQWMTVQAQWIATSLRGRAFENSYTADVCYTGFESVDWLDQEL